MHVVDQIRQRLRAVGYSPVGEVCFGSAWVVQVQGGGHTLEATGATQTVAWQRALLTVETLGVVVPTLGRSGSWGHAPSVARRAPARKVVGAGRSRRWRRRARSCTGEGQRAA
jgi:hypothetical protein